MKFINWEPKGNFKTPQALAALEPFVILIS